MRVLKLIWSWVKEYFTSFVKCDSIENVKEVEVWCDPYCETCLDKALREDEDDLFDSISEPDTEY